MIDRTTYEAGVCARWERDVERVYFQAVALEGWRPEVAHCHDNAATWVAANPGWRVVAGWAAVYGTRITAHSVVARPDGDLIDITPRLGHGIPDFVLFVRHLGDDESFLKLRTERHTFQCAAWAFP